MTAPAAPLVLGLAHPACTDPTLSGAKAANVARAAAAGLPTLPGFALTTVSFDPDDPSWSRGPAPDVVAALRSAWEEIASGGTNPLVVRSSSTVEDIGESSMAGQFRSILDVVGWDAFLIAVRAVLDSARAASSGGAVLPMAVLVQVQLDASIGGVVFGIDPITGDPRHYVIEAVPGGPEKLVSGTVTAQRYVVRHRGRVVQSECDDGDGEALLDAGRLRAVARLVHRADRVFGRAQDVEWAFGPDGQLWLLQSRPVTATGSAVDASGPVLGPGPIGETFPDPLRQLEEDLWIVPLREGIRQALTVTGVVSHRRLASSPVVTLVGGRVAADLDLFGYTPGRRSGWRILDPRPGARRVLAAWRIGQIRNVLPDRVADIVARCDADLAAVPRLSALDDAQLVGMIVRCREHLVAVHGHEVLAGTLLTADEDAPSAAAVALAALADGRAKGLDDGAVIATAPVVLALVPPRVGGLRVLPELPSQVAPRRAAWTGPAARVDRLGPRDALRLRARWLHELSARAAEELGARAVARGLLAQAADVVHFTVAELPHLLVGTVPADLSPRKLSHPGAPLPGAFRSTADGAITPIRRRGDHRPGGRGAGGGRGDGTVCASEQEVEPGAVLVVRTLSPRLAAYLPSLGGLVAETGSVLSHLAILARESGVPTVVAVHDAMHRYPPGTRLLVDGDTGELTVLDAPPAQGEVEPNDGDDHEEATCAG